MAWRQEWTRRSALTALAGLASGLAPDLAAGAEGIRLRDLAGRDVELPRPVRRVVLGEGRLLYLLAALEREDPVARVVGWRRDLEQTDPATYARYLARFPQIGRLPVVGSNEAGALDVERIVALEPDLLLLSTDVAAGGSLSSQAQALMKAGIAVLFVDFRYQPMQNTVPTMRLLGRALGREDRAEAFIAFWSAQIRRVTDVISARQPARPRVFIERIGGYSEECCFSFGRENFGLFAEMAGADNIAANLIPGTFGQVNPEQVIVADPQHVVVTSADWHRFSPQGDWIPVGPGGDAAESLRKLRLYPGKPAYRGSSAARNRRFHAIWHQFYNSPYQFVAIQQMAKWFHPSLFETLQPDATFVELHDRFLPLKYEAGYFASLTSLVE
ncbi:ABC transporter substrate-binding protein [Roseomonas aerophila]|uniref:ABC transporter substrate-binding protein n=1 Tax=Teichococcus aerophilus TaxID=1224513 RepID=A0ABR7RQT7_9PROT|nr:ABC transporter substrate-binding protein [Pseudoroseomonas aerophila]MBC9208971.1 ABC transporter substrate-binding protein [Pseudoroseomonas aerophila]